MVYWHVQNLILQKEVNLLKKLQHKAPLPTSSLLLSEPMWPDWAIYCTLGNFSNPVATIILPKLPTFLYNFCKGFKNLYFYTEIIFRQLLKTFGDLLLVRTCIVVAVYLGRYNVHFISVYLKTCTTPDLQPVWPVMFKSCPKFFH